MFCPISDLAPGCVWELVKKLGYFYVRKKEDGEMIAKAIWMSVYAIALLVIISTNKEVSFVWDSKEN